MPVETGTHVNPGDLIVQIDTRDVQNNYDQAKAHARRRAAPSSTRRRDDKKRNEEMFKARVITPQEYEQVAVDYREREIGVVSAQGEPRPRQAEPRRRDGQGAERRHDHHEERRPSAP